MSKKLANVLSIAGFDPSGGAGLLADAKTFDAHRVLGMGVITANTMQTEDNFEDIQWIEEKEVHKQLMLLLNRYSFDSVKIGLISSLESLIDILELIRGKNPNAFIVWDPVLKATAGYTFHNSLSESELSVVLNKVNLVTPNAEEFSKIPVLKTSCQWLVTSADNSTGDKYIDGDKTRMYRTRRTSEFDKHGSGCVLSSAIAANIARGYTMHKSILRAKDYMYHYLNSAEGLLGRHHKA